MKRFTKDFLKKFLKNRGRPWNQITPTANHTVLPGRKRTLVAKGKRCKPSTKR